MPLAGGVSRVGGGGDRLMRRRASLAIALDHQRLAHLQQHPRLGASLADRLVRHLVLVATVLLASAGPSDAHGGHHGAPGASAGTCTVRRLTEIFVLRVAPLACGACRLTRGPAWLALSRGEVYIIICSVSRKRHSGRWAGLARGEAPAEPSGRARVIAAEAERQGGGLPARYPEDRKATRPSWTPEDVDLELPHGSHCEGERDPHQRGALACQRRIETWHSYDGILSATSCPCVRR